MRNVLVCTAWPYANGPLHLGHFAGCFLPGDIFARYQRMAGNNVLMVSGSDQHGTPITVTAEMENVKPEDVAEKFHRLNSDSLERMGISYDLFSKTHLPDHFEVVHDIFLKLHEKNYIYKRKLMAPFCPKCDRFLPDRYIEGTCPNCAFEDARGDQCDGCGKTLDAEELIEPKCKLCGATPRQKETEQFYLRLTHLVGPLWNMLEDKNYWRPSVIGLTKGWLEEGLEDRAITRDLKWGVPIPLPGYDKKCIYVWFEAVIGYLSCTKQVCEKLGKPEMWKDFWFDRDARIYYFLAKDNIPFHTIIFPAMIAGYDGDMNLPYDVPSNQYLTLNNEQFSKSRKHAVWIPSYLERYPPDLMRYYLTINMPEHKDTDFTWKNFVRTVNEDLIATLGNMIHRVMVLASSYFGEIPPHTDDYVPDETDTGLLEAIEVGRREVGDNIDRCRFQNAVKALMALARKGNEYLTKKEPWKTVKDDRGATQNVVHNMLRVTNALSVMMVPFMPFTAQKLYKMLGNSGDITEISWDADLGKINAGYGLRKPRPLFRKLDLEQVLKQEAEAGQEEAGKKVKTFRPVKKKISFDHFKALDLRAARILSAEDHPNAKNLYLLKVDMGEEEPRQMVAGIKKSYSTSELTGMNIVVVANLEPAVIRGVRSEAMLLAGEDAQGGVSLVTPSKELEPGSRVY